MTTELELRVAQHPSTKPYIREAAAIGILYPIYLRQTSRNEDTSRIRGRVNRATRDLAIAYQSHHGESQEREASALEDDDPNILDYIGGVSNQYVLWKMEQENGNSCKAAFRTIQEHPGLISVLENKIKQLVVVYNNKTKTP